jgi:tetratricopeptide (TPR) repeat protein
MDSRGEVTADRWQMAMIERRFDDAIAVLRSTLPEMQMASPFFGVKADLRGQALAAAGRKAEARAAFEEARAAYEQRLRLGPDDAWSLMQLAWVDANLGRAEAAHREAAQASARMPEAKDAIRGVFLSRTHAAILIATGELDAALAETERLATVNAGFTRADLEMPIFDPLRPHPRFQKVLARLRGR